VNSFKSLGGRLVNCRNNNYGQKHRNLLLPYIMIDKIEGEIK
jgi:hypothetical protein